MSDPTPPPPPWLHARPVSPQDLTDEERAALKARQAEASQQRRQQRRQAVRYLQCFQVCNNILAFRVGLQASRGEDWQEHDPSQPADEELAEIVDTGLRFLDVLQSRFPDLDLGHIPLA